MKENKASLDAVLKKIEREFGKDALVNLKDDQLTNDIPAISTGSLALDIATGIFGVPKGRIIEVFGPESSGKTTLCLHMIAECQRQGGRAAFIDAEHAMSPKYAQNIGVNVEDLLFSQPDSGEQALEMANLLVQSSAVDMVVIDSVAALTPRSEIAGEMGEAQVGVQARLMSHALRKLTGVTQKSGAVVVFINQIRYKIGVMFGNPETTTGGNALKFYASMRFDIRKATTLKEKGDEVVGNTARVKIVKNKMAPPFKTVEFDIIYGRGICRNTEIINLGVETGIIEKAGSWYSYNGKQIGQGKESVRAFLVENKEVAEELQRLIREKYVPAID